MSMEEGKTTATGPPVRKSKVLIYIASVVAIILCTTIAILSLYRTVEGPSLNLTELNRTPSDSVYDPFASTHTKDRSVFNEMLMKYAKKRPVTVAAIFLLSLILSVALIFVVLYLKQKDRLPKPIVRIKPKQPAFYETDMFFGVFVAAVVITGGVTIFNYASRGNNANSNRGLLPAQRPAGGSAGGLPNKRAGSAVEPVIVPTN